MSKNLGKISPEKFIWEKYIGKVGYASSQVLKEIEVIKTEDGFTFRQFKYELETRVKALGYCNANRLIVRQRSEGFAIMLEINEDEVWTHVIEAPEGLTFI